MYTSSASDAFKQDVHFAESNLTDNDGNILDRVRGASETAVSSNLSSHCKTNTAVVRGIVLYESAYRPFAQEGLES